MLDIGVAGGITLEQLAVENCRNHLEFLDKLLSHMYYEGVISFYHYLETFLFIATRGMPGFHHK